MEQWKKYFLKNAKSFGLCIHQRDSDYQLPTKQYFNFQNWNSLLKQKKQKLNILLNDFDFLKGEYQQYMKQDRQNYLLFQQQMKKRLLKLKQFYNNILNLNCKNQIIFENIRYSCISSLKKQIQDIQKELNVQYKDVVCYGQYRREYIQNLKKQIQNTQDMIISNKSRIQSQNNLIEQLYKILNLNYNEVIKGE